MKLLLTSAGLTNPTLKRALEELLGKPAQGVRLVHIPTAALVDDGNKHALIDELSHLKQLGYEVDVVDISGLPPAIWGSRLEAAAVIYVGGGNAYWLNAQLQRSGLADRLPELLQTRVYVGVSAGSSAASQHFSSQLAEYFDEQSEAALAGPTAHGLGLVDFLVKAHFNAPYRPERVESWYAAIAAKLDYPLYALDDQSAVMVDGERRQVVSQGQWQLFNDAAEIT